jgi:hypothetical protein
METQSEVLAEAFEAEANQAPTIVDAGVDAPTVKTTKTAESSKFYTDDDLAKVRSQEKDKLYPQIEKLKSELEEIKQMREAELAAKQAEKEAQDAEERTRLEADLDVRELLKKKETEWSEQLERERQERERAFALLEREKTFAEIQNFRQQRLEEEREAIIPELLDLVTGNTQDEINTSIESLKDRSARKEMTGSRVTAPPTGPLDINSEQRNFTADEISAMPMNEYAKYRQRLLSPKAQGKGSGLFG